MSTQNQTVLNYDVDDNVIAKTYEMTAQDIQNMVIQKITDIRKIHLILGFSQATLADELDKRRGLSKQLSYLEWQNTEACNIASAIVAEMEERNVVIDELLNKIQSTRNELAKEEKELGIYLSYKRSLQVIN
jgi:hypothetical protein